MYIYWVRRLIKTKLYSGSTSVRHTDKHHLLLFINVWYVNVSKKSIMNILEIFIFYLLLFTFECMVELDDECIKSTPTQEHCLMVYTVKAAVSCQPVPRIPGIHLCTVAVLRYLIFYCFCIPRVAENQSFFSYYQNCTL